MVCLPSKNQKFGPTVEKLILKSSQNIDVTICETQQDLQVHYSGKVSWHFVKTDSLPKILL